MIRDDKTKELYVWRRMNIVFHKKLSKKLENKLIQREKDLELGPRYVSDEELADRILWKYESSYRFHSV